MVEGLIYGEDPRQGFAENNVFYHPELKFQFPLPGGWITNNTPLQVQIAPDDGQALIVLSLATEQSLDETAAAAIERNNLVVEQRQTLNVNGFPSIRLLSTVVNEQDPKANLISSFYHSIIPSTHHSITPEKLLIEIKPRIPRIHTKSAFGFRPNSPFPQCPS